MATGTISEQISQQQTQISALSALVQGTRDPGKFYAITGSNVVFGCKVTQGYSATDMVLALEGAASGDSAHLNPDLQVVPTRPEEYSNIALVYGETFLMPDRNVLSLQEASLIVSTAPGTGYHRYDLVYIYVGTSGYSIGIAAGTAVLNASTPTDPTLAVGTLVLARVHVESNVTGIANSKITDLRNFSGRLRGATGTSATIAAGTNTAIDDAASPTVSNSGTSSAATFNFTTPKGASSGLKFAWSTSTAATDPTSGIIKVNNASLASVTNIYISETDNYTNSVATELASWDDSTSSVKGTIKIYNPLAPTNVAIYRVSGALVDNGAWDTIPVTYVSSSGSFSAADKLRVEFSRTGDIGATGATGTSATIAAGTNTAIDDAASPTVSNSGTSSAATFNFTTPKGASSGLKFAWSTSTAATDPTSGIIKVNNASLASVTNIYISETDNYTNSVATELASWDDSTSSVKGTIKIYNPLAPTNVAIYRVSGALVGNGAWDTIPVTYVSSSGSFSAADKLRVEFSRTGDIGATGTSATIAAGTNTAIDDAASPTVSNSGTSSAATFNFTTPKGASSGLKFAWSTSTAATDPTSGIIKVNNASLASVTNIYISETDNYTNSVATELASWDDSTSSVKGTIKIYNPLAPTNVAIYRVSGALVGNGAWDTIPVTYVSSSGSFSAADKLRVEFSRTGDIGATGATGPTGPAGTNGVDGSVWRSGSGIPSNSLGVDNDFYLDVSTDDVYKRVAGVYVLQVNIKGSAGATGAAGSVWRDGAGVPSNALGVNGDYYLNATNGDVYFKATGTYSVVANIKGATGATGAAGTNGTNGTNGADGADGICSGFKYLWSTNTTSTDPTSGFIKVNNASFASVTNIYISETEGNSVSIASEIASWDDSTSSVKGTIKIYNPLAPTNVAIYRVSGALVDNGAWDTIPVTYVSSSGSFSAADKLRVEFSRTGDKGANGVGTVTSVSMPVDFTVSNQTTNASATWNSEVSVASSATTAIGAAASRCVQITGITTITSFDNVASGIVRLVRFAGSLTLTHNATSLILPNNGASILTAAGDSLVAESLGSGDWVVLSYQAAGGYSPVPSSALSITKTGNYLFDPVFILSPPRSVDVAGSFAAVQGKWVEAISYNEISSPIATLSSWSFDDLVGTVGSFSPNAMAALTTLSVPALTSVGGNFAPSNMAALTTLSVPALTSVGGVFSPNNMAALTTLSVPALTSVGSNFSPNAMAALTTLSVPALTSVGGNFVPSNMAALTTLSVPALTSVGSNFVPSIMAALTTLSVPALTSVGGVFSPNNMAALTTLSVPALTSVGGDITMSTGTAALTSFTLGSTLKAVGGDVTITSAALTQASVDALLVRLASLDGTGGTTAFSSPRTVTITGTSATPSATGIAAKATLVARGVTVTTN